MRDGTECRSYVDHMAAEHRRMHGVMQSLREAMARSVGPDEERSIAEMRQVLMRLRDELKHHFMQEESGGCIEEAVSRCPRLSGEGKRIVDEHGEITAKVESLVSHSASCQPTAANQCALHSAFEELCTQLQAHEAAETELMLQAFGACVEEEEVVPPPKHPTAR